ncbi:MAG: hypothetical protein IT379_15750 [Deltaproteobacteria bacterium]|nr:hypothetical protein [Deltaproteobacteria bacterium]
MSERGWRTIAGVGAASMLAMAACGDDGGSMEVCDLAGVERALSRASAGSVVELGACRIEGRISIPAGVTLRGRGRDATTLASTTGAVVTMSPGDAASVLEDVTVESAGDYGLLARGAGAVEIHRVAVTASRGYAFGAEDVTGVTLTDVEATGSTDASNVAMLPSAPAREATATRGIVLIRVGSASLADVTVRGFAVTGLYADAGRLEWRGGGARANAGTGVLLYRADAVLADLDLGATLQRASEDTFAAVVAEGAALEASRLSITSNASFGILQSEASATYTDLRASDNGSAALWVQLSDRMEITGSSELRDNALAGIVAVDSSGIRVTGATIAGTRERTRVGDDMTAVAIGDGVQLVGSMSDVALSALRLEANARVGLLIDGGGGTIDGILLDGVDVSGSGDALGVIAQASIVGPDWDSGVTRDAVTAANDGAFTGTLDLASIVGPDWTPPPDGASLDD